LIRNLLTIIRKKEDSITKIIAIITILILVSYFIDAFFNYPLYRPTMQFSFAFLLAFTILNNSNSGNTKAEYLKKDFLLTGIIVVNLLIIYFTFEILRAYQLEYDIKYKKIKSTEIKGRLPLILNVGVYGEPFVQHLGVAYYLENNFVKATECFNLAKQINPYQGTPEWYLSRIEQSKGNINTAYNYAKIAFYKRPRQELFFRQAVTMAIQKKDTSQILKIHNIFSSYRKMPVAWLDVSYALYVSNYKISKIIALVDNGLLYFPKDTKLLEQKKSLTAQLKRIKNSTNLSSKEYLISPLINYMVKAKKMGDQLKFEKAIEYYKIAHKINPQEIAALQGIGICYYKLNKPQIAIKYLIQTLDNTNLERGKTEYVLAGCYFNLNDKKNACKYMKIAFIKKYPISEALLNQFCN
jgi:tetratricopeptide (TPR) repeat protein